MDIAQTSKNSSLAALPDEVQQLIYRHVYPFTDITLLPDDHPDFVPKFLTQTFNVVGSHTVALLLTCSKICAIAKPIRDSTFTGVVKVARPQDLISCGHWIHHNVHTIRFVTPTPSTTAYKLHPTLFSNLRRIEITNTQPRTSTQFNLSEQKVIDFVLIGRGFNSDFSNDALDLYQKLFYRPLLARSRRREDMVLFTDVVFIVRQRYMGRAGSLETTDMAVGAVVRIIELTPKVIGKAFYHESNLKVWREDIPGIVTVPSLHHINQKIQDDNTDSPFQSSSTLTAKEVEQISLSYAWLKPQTDTVGLEDLL